MDLTLHTQIVTQNIKNIMKQYNLKFATLLFSILLHWIDHTIAHSHVECTKLSQDGSQCAGYARYYDYNKREFKNTTESRDRNYIVAPGTLTCPPLPIAGEQEYTNSYPMASVVPGERVTVQWPPRGHAKQNHSPVWIYCSPTPGKMDPKTEKDVQLMAEMKYDNCKGDDVSWAICTGEFEVPTNWTTGVRSCQWVWTLNGGQTYVDCFEYDVAAVVNDGSSSDSDMSSSLPALKVSSSGSNDTQSEILGINLSGDCISLDFAISLCAQMTKLCVVDEGNAPLNPEMRQKCEEFIIDCMKL